MGKRQTERSNNTSCEVITSASDDRDEPVPKSIIQHTDPMELVRIALETKADVDALEKLLMLKREHDADVAKRAYIEAMTQAKRELPSTFQKTKSSHNAKYAELSDICSVATPILASHGLSVDWVPDQSQPNWVTIACRITHEMGHSEMFVLSGPPDKTGSKNDVQAIASTVSYLERYTLKAALGIAERGQDNNAKVDSGSVGENQSADRKSDKLLTDAQFIELDKCIEEMAHVGLDDQSKWLHQQLYQLPSPSSTRASVLIDRARKAIKSAHDALPKDTADVGVHDDGWWERNSVGYDDSIREPGEEG